ncbi:MAG TPA: protein-glutamate O-methyltransferase CheR [Gemmatirosa sp.]
MINTSNAPAPAGVGELAPAEYAFLSDLLARESGLALGPDKGYLIRTRLAPAAAAWGGGTLRGLVAALRTEQVRGRPGARSATRAVCDAMTTNETLFFRDGHPFEAFRDVILPAAASRRITAGGPLRPIRVWSAASSTGQEPYSLAICAVQAAPRLCGVPVEIVASDYSPSALQRARDGVYTDFETRRGLDPAIAARFLTPVPGGLRVADALRRMIRFEERNLLEPFTGLGVFDVIFCRNVLLYFDAATKRGILDRMAEALAPGGVLILGGAETPLGVSGKLVRAGGLPTPGYEVGEKGKGEREASRLIRPA